MTEAEAPAAPEIEKGPGNIKLVSRRESDDARQTDRAFRFVGFNLHVVGEDFPHPGEVVVDIARANGQDHQRFSTWTDDGAIDIPVPGINGVGDWVLRCESLVTQVGEGGPGQIIKATKELEFELY
jgi:hypothetical protein